MATMDGGQKLIVSALFLSLMILGFAGLFNLGGALGTAFDTSFAMRTSTFWWLIGKVMSIALIVIPGYVGYLMWKEG